MVLLLSSPAAMAENLDFKKETMAGYFLLGAGQTGLGTAAVNGETSQTLSYSGDSKSFYGAEFGLTYSGEGGSLRFGIELLSPAALKSAATNSGQKQYDVVSEVTAYAPKLTFDLNLRGDAQSRSYISLGVSLINLILKNSYTLTAAGQTSFPGVNDHSWEAKGAATALSVALGHEAHLLDKTTINIEFGYRQLKVDNLKYSDSVTTFDGTHAGGDYVSGGSGHRELGLSGVFINIGFRFYL